MSGWLTLIVGVNFLGLKDCITGNTVFVEVLRGDLGDKK